MTVALFEYHRAIYGGVTSTRRKVWQCFYKKRKEIFEQKRAKLSATGTHVSGVVRRSNERTVRDRMCCQFQLSPLPLTSQQLDIPKML